MKKELSEKEYGKLKGAMRALRKKEEKLSGEEKQVLKCLFGHSPELETAYNFCREPTDIFEDDIGERQPIYPIFLQCCGSCAGSLSQSFILMQIQKAYRRKRFRNY